MNNVINDMIRFLKMEHKKRKDKKECAKIAKIFNNRYTYRNRLGADYKWMCPKCNMIYSPFESSVFDGLHYPACCSYPEGNRLLYDIKLPKIL